MSTYLILLALVMILSNQGISTSYQKIIFHAMKCKQNTEVSYSEILLKEVNLLIDSYFDDHGKLHLNELMSK